MSDSEYDVVVVGGGPAGLTAALYTTRLGLDTALVDRGGGRAAMMQDTHNVIGVTEETSGVEFLETAKAQVESYGADVHRDFIEAAERLDDGSFALEGGDATYGADSVVLATGFSDARPDPPLPPTGRGLHYCLHCDAYMFVDEPVYVMGTGDSAAYVAMIMLNFTDDVDVLLRGDDPEWSDDTAEMLDDHPVEVVREEITASNRDDDGWLESFEFEDGTVREYRGGFPMLGSEYNTDLHESLGCEITDDGTVAVVPGDAEAFTVELQGIIADAGLGLQSMEREAGLEAIDPHVAVELAELDLLVLREDDSRLLLAVPEGRVVKRDVVRKRRRVRPVVVAGPVGVAAVRIGVRHTSRHPQEPD